MDGGGAGQARGSANSTPTGAKVDALGFSNGSGNDPNSPSKASAASGFFLDSNDPEKVERVLSIRRNIRKRTDLRVEYFQVAAKIEEITVMQKIQVATLVRLSVDYLVQLQRKRALEARVKSFTGLMGFGGINAMFAASGALQNSSGAGADGGKKSPDDEKQARLGEPVNVELTQEYLDDLKKHSFDYRVMYQRSIEVQS